MLVEPGFKSTRQTGLVNLGEPSSKFSVGLLDGSRVFQAEVNKLPLTLDGLLCDGWDDSS